jgi:hypothetical protein
MSAGNDPSAEYALIQRCRAADQAAWSQLHATYHGPLLGAILKHLGRKNNLELAEEIAARVWASLVFQNGCRLAAFDPGRGKLLRFLSTLARQEISHFFRPRSRNGRHEVPLTTDQAAATEVEFPLEIESVRDGFVTRLTKAERKFFVEYVLGPPGTPPANISPQNFRKLKHRVFRKLHQFLHLE